MGEQQSNYVPAESFSIPYLLFHRHYGAIITGHLSIIGGMSLTLDSDLNGPTPRLTLACISTGRPATTVTWTRDFTTVTQITQTVFNDPVTARYSHTLIVTGRYPGLYTCTVANHKPSLASANIIIPGIN